MKHNASVVTTADFYALMPQHCYIFAATGETWPASSVNSQIPPIALVNSDGTLKLDENGRVICLSASAWLDRYQPVEQLTWMPGEPQLIRDRLVVQGGFIEWPGATIFNLYHAPHTQPGDPEAAGPWLDHIRKVYPEDAEHIIRWLAHRVQKPGEKINHALLLGGAPGIGKDTLLHPVITAIGSWNFVEVTPVQVQGRFNGFVKSVILRINEGRDLGEINRFAFYEHLKLLTAAPPEVLRCDGKNKREYAVPNVTGVVITSNYLTDGIHLPPDDRRHYVAWSPLSAGSLPPEYFDKLYRWYEQDGGCGHVAAFLNAFDLTDFNPKAPPKKTEAFWSIVDANQGAEEGGLADTIDAMTPENGRPPEVITLERLSIHCSAALAIWINDPKNRRPVPKLLEKVGYLRVAKPGADDGRWKINGKRQTVYGHKSLTPREQIAAAMLLGGHESGP